MKTGEQIIAIMKKAMANKRLGPMHNFWMVQRHDSQVMGRKCLFFSDTQKDNHEASQLFFYLTGH